MANSGQPILDTTVTATGNAVQPPASRRTFHGLVEGTGAVAATFEIYGSNTDLSGAAGTNGILLGTITLSGTTSAADGFVTDAPWINAWAKCTAISGTGARGRVFLGA